MIDSEPTCDLFILSAVTDVGFIESILPHQISQCRVNGSKILQIDTSKVSGYYKNNRHNFPIHKLISIANRFKQLGLIDEIIEVNYNKQFQNKIYKKHFGNQWAPTHCFRGYPYYASILPFEYTNSDYFVHLDSDMLMFQDKGFNWISESIKIMENNHDIVCCLPLSGPPTENGQLFQGTTKYIKDDTRNIYLFKNFTSRVFIVNVKRFMKLCPMKVKWLSWREPLKSKFLGNGSMLCWEVTVTDALEKSNLWRADLMTNKAWTLHPGDRTEVFYEILPKIIQSVSQNKFPDKQRGHFDVLLNHWIKFLS